MRTEIKQRLDELLAGLLLQIEADAISLRDERYENGEDQLHGMVKKLTRHLVSLNSLLTPCQVKFLGKSGTFVDFASIAVLARAVLEGCLVMEWLFGPDDPELKAFRLQLWNYASAWDQAKMGPTSEPGISIAKDAYGYVQEMKPFIKEGLTKHYSDLSRFKKERVLKGQWTSSFTLLNLASTANIPSIYYRTYYSILSSHAHSAASSSLNQIDQRLDDEEHAWGIAHMLIPFVAKAMALYRRVRAPAERALANQLSILAVIAEQLDSLAQQQADESNAWLPPV